MTVWWNSLGVTGQIFALIAIPATLILIVQTILLFFGVGDGVDGGIDLNGDGVADFHLDDGSGGTVFSIRGLVAMLCVGGWSRLALYQSGVRLWLTITLASLFGILALVLIGYMMKLVMKLQDSGNIDIGYAIGKSGKVYIPIPPSMSGSGKINITLQERFIEVDAVSTCDRTLKTGETVRVIATDDAGTLVVEPVFDAVQDTAEIRKQ